MSKFLHPLLMMIASATEKELAGHVQYLKEENRILRSKLPKRITVTAKERRRLLRFGKPVGAAIKELMTIVSPRTFARWASGEEKRGQSAPKMPGRPNIAQQVREVIVKLGKETEWGYSRIQGELLKLGLGKISRGTIRNILIENGLDPGPKCGETTWDQFLKSHAKTLYACDFFTKKVWTMRGFVEMYLLVFIQIGSRRVWVSPATANPNGRWVEQQARNVCMVLQEQGETPTYLIRDRDTKFTKHFDEIFKTEGVRVQKLPKQSPNLNAYAERWIQSIKHECLDHFVVFGEDHLNHLVQEYVAYYHNERTHQRLGNRPPLKQDLPDEGQPIDTSQIVCRERLGGLLKHYERVAA